jgi:hypothetical protein
MEYKALLGFCVMVTIGTVTGLACITLKQLPLWERIYGALILLLVGLALFAGGYGSLWGVLLLVSSFIMSFVILVKKTRSKNERRVRY